jgi:hypothetical protein
MGKTSAADPRSSTVVCGDDSEGKVRITDAHVRLLLAAFEKQLRAIMSNRMRSRVNGMPSHP